MPNTIQLKGDYYRGEEDIASGTIKPGHLIELHTSSGRKVRVHSTVGGYAERAVAVEDALQGNTVDDSYSSGDRVFYHLCLPGDKIMMWLKAGENVAIGDKLMSAGDGTLQEYEAGDSLVAEHVVAIAEEALDLSASGAVATFIKVRLV